MGKDNFIISELEYLLNSDLGDLFKNVDSWWNKNTQYESNPIGEVIRTYPLPWYQRNTTGELNSTGEVISFRKNLYHAIRYVDIATKIMKTVSGDYANTPIANIENRKKEKILVINGLTYPKDNSGQLISIEKLENLTNSKDPQQDIQFFEYKIEVTKQDVSIDYGNNQIIPLIHQDDNSIVNCKDTIINTLVVNYNKYDKKNETLLERINYISDNTINELVFTILFSSAFEIVCRSVLSGEYAMDDLFSKRLRDMGKNLQKKINDLSNKEQAIIRLSHKKDNKSPILSYIPGDALNFFISCAVALSKILDEYNLFCIQTDAQVDKDPSAILDNLEEYYGYHQYEEYLKKFLLDFSDETRGGGFRLVNPLLVHFFQVFLEMTRIDQNFFFSKDRFKKLLYLKKLLNENDDQSNGKEIWQVWKKYQNDATFLELEFSNIKDLLHLINLKNDFLIRKTIDSCYDQVKDLIYVGQRKKYVFDPRKCQDIDRDVSFAELLLCNKSSNSKSEIQNINNLYNEFTKITKKRITEESSKSNSEEPSGEQPLACVFDEYEKKYIKAIHERKESDEINGLDDYFDKVFKSQTSRTSKDIRHYNTKVLEMARDAIYDTIEMRSWINHHRHDFDEEKGFNQIKKVLLFIQDRYEGDGVCYDNEMLVGYAGWCLDFLEIIAKNPPKPESDRPSQIEEALLLLETLNRLLDKLIKSIEEKKYCLPYASKYRGCFFLYDNSQLIRVFTGVQKKDNYKPENFESFVNADYRYKNERKNIVFIASSYVPPLNYEKLKNECSKFKYRTLKQRSEIHADYFNRLRDYIKEDSEKQLENNRRSVVQILGIFAAFLALTTVALSATNSKTDLPFITIMVGFTTCILVFVFLLYLITYSKIQRDYETYRFQDKLIQQQTNLEIKKLVNHIKNTKFDFDRNPSTFNNNLLTKLNNIIKKITSLDNNNTKIQEQLNGIKAEINEIQQQSSDQSVEKLDKKIECIEYKINCFKDICDFEDKINRVEDKIDRIKPLKRERYHLTKSRKLHPLRWIISLLVLMIALTVFLSIYGRGKNSTSTAKIFITTETKQKPVLEGFNYAFRHFNADNNNTAKESVNNETRNVNNPQNSVKTSESNSNK